MNNDFTKNDEELSYEKEHNCLILEKHEQFYTIKNNNSGDIYTLDKKEIIKPKSPKQIMSSIFGLIFLIWFFVSLGLIFYFSKINQYYMVICFGQYFLVFGLVAVFNKLWPGIIFILVGLALIIIPLLMMKPTININWEKVIPLLVLSVFMIIGLCLMFVPTILKKVKLKKTTLNLTAKVIGLNESYSDNTKVFAPVYEYSFNNKTYQKKADIYTNIDIPNIGDIVNIMINPHNPEEIYVKEASKTTTIILSVMGLLFVFMSGLSIYLFLFAK